MSYVLPSSIQKVRFLLAQLKESPTAYLFSNIFWESTVILKEVYLDNSATTVPYKEVIELMSGVQSETFGNPSSMHAKGIEAERLIKKARRSIAGFFTGREEEIYFTGSGTESNNLAILGAVKSMNKQQHHLITSCIEHSSVLNGFLHLERNGFKVSYLSVDNNGIVDLDQLDKLVTKNTALVSIIHVQNEIGSIQPMEQIGALIKDRNPETVFHVDAVQTFSKLPIKVNSWHADLVSCSAHKIHGPKGVGCLWVRNRNILQPLMHGGNQEAGIRPGTENTAGIVGFELAALMTAKDQTPKAAQLNDLKLTFYRELLKKKANFKVNGPPPDQGAPHIINLSFPGLKGELLLHALEEQGIFCSSGSACSSRHPEPSHILQAIGLSKESIESALRFSFSVFNNKQEVAYAARQTAKTVSELTCFFKKKQ